MIWPLLSLLLFPLYFCLPPSAPLTIHRRKNICFKTFLWFLNGSSNLLIPSYHHLDAAVVVHDMPSTDSHFDDDVVVENRYSQQFSCSKLEARCCCASSVCDVLRMNMIRAQKKIFFWNKTSNSVLYVREMSKWRGVRDLLIKNCWIFNNCTHMNMNQSNNEITYKSNNEKKFNYNFYWIFLVLRFFHNVEIVSVNWLWLFLLASAWYWFQFRRHSNLTLNKNKELHRLDQ